MLYTPHRKTGFVYCHRHHIERFGNALHSQLCAAAEAFAARLLALPDFVPGLSDYGNRYLTDHRKVLPHSLSVITQLLGEVMSAARGPARDLTLLDLGAGVGLMSHFAVLLGFKRVICTDVYELSVADAGALGRALELEPHELITGGFDEVVMRLGPRQADVDCLVMADVIEHIYNVDEFISDLSRFGSSKFTAAFSTVSNRLNPLIAYRLRRYQRWIENVDRTALPGHKPNDSLSSYLKLRKRIILEHAGSQLSASQASALAKATRGLVKRDIEAAVDHYLASGSMRREPMDPTDTCDPITGNWCEHMLDPRELANELNSLGFHAEVLPQFYAMTGSHKFSHVVKRLVNRLAAGLPGAALHLSKGYCVAARRA